MVWTNTSSLSTTWTEAFGSPQFGVPYDSDLLYNGSHTYNEASTPFRPVWLAPNEEPTTWT